MFPWQTHVLLRPSWMHRDVSSQSAFLHVWEGPMKSCSVNIPTASRPIRNSAPDISVLRCFCLYKVQIYLCLLCVVPTKFSRLSLFWRNTNKAYDITCPDRLWDPLSLLSKGRKAAEELKLTTHFQLVQKPRKHGSIHPLPHTSLWSSA
jgi:hypothetical protein